MKAKKTNGKIAPRSLRRDTKFPRNTEDVSKSVGTCRNCISRNPPEFDAHEAPKITSISTGTAREYASPGARPSKNSPIPAPRGPSQTPRFHPQEKPKSEADHRMYLLPKLENLGGGRPNPPQANAGGRERRRIRSLPAASDLDLSQPPGGDKEARQEEQEEEEEGAGLRHCSHWRRRRVIKQRRREPPKRL